MTFIPISIDAYIELCTKQNPSIDATALRNQLESALNDYHAGVKCACGCDIWVIGSAHAGINCFACFTGESTPDADFEIDEAVLKRPARKRGRHMNDIPPHEINRYFDDDGYEIIIDHMKKPHLCLLCINDDDPGQEILCNLTRLDYEEGREFICHAFKRRNS